jgi:GNAT superfamily N-acetyltransferase
VDIPIRQLSCAERRALLEHFLKLGSQDRRLRFGTPLSDHALREYVERIDFAHDAVFAVANDELQLLGVAHLARADGHAELGISVLEGQRGGGIGGALLARAHQHARNWGVNALFMHCLTENAAMMHLARRQAMQIVAEAGEADAWLRLPPADAASHFGAMFAQRAALFDHALKSQLAAARRFAAALRPGTGSRDREK